MKDYVGLKHIKAVEMFDCYEVVYADGYKSWSPKKVFESAYKSFDKLGFSEALFLLKQGYRIAREGWNGKGMWLKLQVPDEHSKMRRPYIYMYPVDRELVPWVASQTDMLAEDWCVVYDKEEAE